MKNIQKIDQAELDALRAFVCGWLTRDVYPTDQKTGIEDLMGDKVKFKAQRQQELRDQEKKRRAS